MDITIETAVVALVALVAAVAVLGIATGQIDSFTNFSDEQTEGANCQLLETQADNCRWSPSEELPDSAESCDFEVPEDC